MTDRIKASCHDICPYRNKNCFGGYLVEEPLCDKEIARIENLHRLTFLPIESKGLTFVDSRYEVVCTLKNGHIVYEQTQNVH